jgi:hypothetical protein
MNLNHRNRAADPCSCGHSTTETNVNPLQSLKSQ